MSQDSRTEVNKKNTRHLKPKGDIPLMKARRTHPLDLRAVKNIRFVLPENSAVFEVPMRRALVIGRKVTLEDSQVDIDLTPFGAYNSGVSRYHAVIQINRGRVSIQDTSTNGTFLNGFALDPNLSYRVRHGDKLSLGKLHMRIYFVGGKTNSN